MTYVKEGDSWDDPKPDVLARKLSEGAADLERAGRLPITVRHMRMASIVLRAAIAKAKGEEQGK